MSKSKSKGDVQWLIPNRKTPIAYSTKAVCDFIQYMAQHYKTIEDIYDNINYDMGAKEIMKKYIDKGYGSQIAREWFN